MFEILDAVPEVVTGSFFDLLGQWQKAESVGSDDLLAAMLPLLEQVQRQHDQSQVAPLDGVDRLHLHEGRELWFNVREARPVIEDDAKLRAITQPRSEGVEIVGELDIYELDGFDHIDNKWIARRGQEPDQPLYYLDYTSWEIMAGHHDALTDVFLLGMLMGSLAMRLDFTRSDDLKRFIAYRRNVHAANPRIHPVISRLIRHMTELRREHRAQDLSAIIEILDNYRRTEADDFDERLRALEAITDPDERRIQIQEYLRNRLFEVSRRNRLLYFKDTAASANLTLGSFPNLLDYKLIRTDQLLITNDRFCSVLDQAYEADGDNAWFALSSYLRFEDYPFLAPSLDKIRLQAQTDAKEYGFSQLRLVLTTLRWHNLTRNPEERIESPFILLPVEIRKTRGTEHGFELTPKETLREAEVNPVLRHHLREVYGVELPETVDLTQPSGIKYLHEALERAIQRRHGGVTINSVTKPRIRLIQRTVSRRLEDYERKTRRRTGRGLKDYRGHVYSYDVDKYAPLGLVLFERIVRPTAAPGRDMAEHGRPTDLGTNRPKTERESTGDFYSIDKGNESGPLNWEIDLTSVTLANFNYRKMSLVRDYAELRSLTGGEHANFNRLFTQEARDARDAVEPPAYHERYQVLPTDPSQDRAIFRARGGESYVIQGPPGTGKSQTIANLLADFAARGQRVLFVCEKRVALDVVRHRLAEAGLEDLTSLIHNSRDDRKPLLASLKQLYETWRRDPKASDTDAQRQKAVERIDAALRELSEFSSGMTAQAVGCSEPLHLMIEQAVGRAGSEPELTTADREYLPTWNDLDAARDPLVQIERTAQRDGALSVNPAALCRCINPELANHERPLEQLGRLLLEVRRAVPVFNRLQSSVVLGPGRHEATLDEMVTQSQWARRIEPLLQADQLSLLDPTSPSRRNLLDELQRLQRRRTVLEAQMADSPWVGQPNAQETAVALNVARNREGKLFSFLFGDWRRVQRWVRQNYQGEIFNVTALLEQLAGLQEQLAALDGEYVAIADCYGTDKPEDLLQLALDVDALDYTSSTPARALIDFCVSSPAAARERITTLANENDHVLRVASLMDELLVGHEGATPAQIDADLARFDGHRDTLVALLPALKDLAERAPRAMAGWRRLGLSFADFETATLFEAIRKSYRAEPRVEAFDGQRLGETCKRLAQALTDLRELNGRKLIEDCRGRFRDKFGRARSSPRPGPANDPLADYKEGCRLLEHQFGLTRPSKSVRELLAGESGTVLRDLKPIWMMSPLSVADTLPLSEELFDAVVFDEASQIPIEDALPALYRAKQTIIVGDEMQLPPTSFFAGNKESDEPLPDYLAYAVSADSLLTKAQATLPATGLNWHYRSRHESLISFCNRAFYAGSLYTIPGRRPLTERAEILIDHIPTGQRDVNQLAAPLLDRPISHHRLENAVYRNQQNGDEAEYIAALVRSFLRGKSNQSIGVVAFSQSQAQAIETAIEELSLQDRRFATALERERERTSDGQFSGFFVKNLENVQGDERDVIVISVGYAPGPDGRMRMNFGPINQSGGEKRLNVIFSRAKAHLALVTSISHNQITNDYNVGANTLKQFLHYAQLTSAGRADDLERCLSAIGPAPVGMAAKANAASPSVAHAADELRKQGFEIALGVGHSGLIVDVAGRPSNSDEFKIATLIDTDSHYAVSDIVERYITRPAVLGAFGWGVHQRLGKDLMRSSQ